MLESAWLNLYATEALNHVQPNIYHFCSCRLLLGQETPCIFVGGGSPVAPLDDGVISSGRPLIPAESNWMPRSPVWECERSPAGSGRRQARQARLGSQTANGEVRRVPLQRLNKLRINNIHRSASTAWSLL